MSELTREQRDELRAKAEDENGDGYVELDSSDLLTLLDAVDDRDRLVSNALERRNPMRDMQAERDAARAEAAELRRQLDAMTGYRNPFAQDFLALQAKLAEVRTAVSPDVVLALVERVRTAEAKLALPCGSCHPCNEWAAETWRRAGGKLPHKHTVDEAFADLDRLRDGLTALADEWDLLAGGGGIAAIPARDARDRLRALVTDTGSQG